MKGKKRRVEACIGELLGLSTIGGDFIISESLLPQEEYKDTLNLADGMFSGVGHYYIFNGKGFEHKTVNFSSKKGKPLSGFRYKKPRVTDTVFNPEEEWENIERRGYYPLAFVKKAYRGPNHWHRKDNALFCAVNIKGRWQTRYFPQSNIPEETWKEAEDILGEHEKEK